MRKVYGQHKNNYNNNNSNNQNKENPPKQNEKQKKPENENYKITYSQYGYIKIEESLYSNNEINNLPFIISCRPALIRNIPVVTGISPCGNSMCTDQFCMHQLCIRVIQCTHMRHQLHIPILFRILNQRTSHQCKRIAFRFIIGIYQHPPRIHPFTFGLFFLNLFGIFCIAFIQIVSQNRHHRLSVYIQQASHPFHLPI